MAKPYVHARSSAKRFGGVPEDYLAVHDLKDSSKRVLADNRHRALTHHTWFSFVCERVLGHNTVNSAGRLVSVRDLAEQHDEEDFVHGGGYVPTAADYAEYFRSPEEWMRSAEVTIADQARHSAERFGGLPEDYLELHRLIDSSREAISGWRHRLLTHHTFFAQLAERVFGAEIERSGGGSVASFDVLCEHMLYELGRVPAAQEWLCKLDYADWFSNGAGDPPTSVSRVLARRQPSIGSRTIFTLD